MMVTAENTVRPRPLARLCETLLSIARLRWRPRTVSLEEAPEGRPYPWEASYPEGIDWGMAIAEGTMPGLFDRAVATYGDDPCLEFLGKRYTYREVGGLVDRAARGFQDLGVKKGDRVGLFLPNTPYYVICYFAVLKAGGIVVNFNPLYAERGIARQIKDSGARIMVTINLSALYPKIAGRLDDTELEKIVVCRMSAALPFPENALFTLLKRREMSAVPSDERHVKFEKLISNEGDFAGPTPLPGDVAVLQYTGGTTGTPKGAMLSHANLHANAVQTRAWAPEIGNGNEKILAVLPLFHAFGMTGAMNVGFRIGAELLLAPRFKVDEVLKAIDKEKPTLLLGVPTMFSALNGHKAIDKFDLSSLKTCISGGAALPLDVKSRFEELTGCVLVEGYGLTESGPVATVNPTTGLNKPGSAGLPIPGTVIEIVSLDAPGNRMPPGKSGEVCLSGPQVMLGYWNRPEDSAEVLEHGRLHTGDIGYLDEDGYLFLMDRIKDLVITGGFNVYPRMVEEAISLHPSVAEVAVCGVPSTHHGELVKAYVILTDGARLNAPGLRTFLKDKLASFEMPRRIEFVDEIPRTMLGKPLRRELIAEELRRAGLPGVPSATPGASDAEELEEQGAAE